MVVSTAARSTITSPYSNTGTTIVRGYQSIKIKTPTTTVYCCKNIRFRTSGRFTVQIDQGVGVELSVVGRGKAMLRGAGYAELGLSDGTYQLNDSPAVPVPDVATWVTIKAPMPPPPPKRRSTDPRLWHAGRGNARHRNRPDDPRRRG